MGQRVVKLPDGRLGLFSTVTEAYVAAGNEDHLLKTMLDSGLWSGEDSARRAIRRGLEDAGTYGQGWPADEPCDGLRRFRESLGEMAQNRDLNAYLRQVKRLNPTSEWLAYAEQTHDRVTEERRVNAELEEGRC